MLPFSRFPLVMLLLTPLLLPAQDNSKNTVQTEVERLTKEMTAQRARLDELQKQLDIIISQQPKPLKSDPVTVKSEEPPVKHHEHTSHAETLDSEHSKWSPEQPITLFRSGKSYLNISLVGDIAVGGSTDPDVGTLQMGGHDPSQRGFTIQGIETMLEGVVDDYFRALATLNYSLDTEGNSSFELEEAYAETLGLPGNFQLRVGQYLTDFGRINTQHLHTWSFVDAPIVTARFFGPDSLRNPGARISWQPPASFDSELSVGIQNSQGETAYSFRNDFGEDHGHSHGSDGGQMFGRNSVDTKVHSLADLLYSARYAASFDLGKTQSITGGISGAWGPNSTGEDARTQIYGADVFWKWMPAHHHHGFPFVSLQAEVMFRGYGAGAQEVDSVDPVTGLVSHVDLPQETLWDWGTYAQINVGLFEGWVASLRGDYSEPITHGKYEDILGQDDSSRAWRFRVSPALTWYPSDFSRIRLQYNYDRGDDFGSAHSVWLQLEFLLGHHDEHQGKCAHADH